MSQIITIGGNRLGSGKKMQTAIKDYERSNHNLSTKFTSSIASGLLYPCLGLIGNRGDTFTINLKAAARTLPTMGALYGSYKLQVDLFQCDFRLYQALLHNNPLAVGLKMNQVKLPKIEVETYKDNAHPFEDEFGKFSNSCLQKYLGMSGIGTPMTDGGSTFKRKYLAIPTLAYYDIFKNYYANKQEGIGYVVVPNDKKAGYVSNGLTWWNDTKIPYNGIKTPMNQTQQIEINSETTKYATLTPNILANCIYLGFSYFEVDVENPTISRMSLWEYNNESMSIQLIEENNNKYLWLNGITKNEIKETIQQINGDVIDTNKRIYLWAYTKYPTTEGLNVEDIYLNYKHGIKLEQFDLQNIDDMRYDILTHHTLGAPYIINTFNKLPYKVNHDKINTKAGGNETTNKCEHVGLVCKTYQNDIFNNWLKNEWIEGENSIAELSKVAVVDNAFKIDSLILGEAIYNMLNRIALSDATYYSWLNVTYTDNGARHIESPIFVGGLSGEIMFEEIVQTAPADGDPLGTLGGRGMLQGGDGHVVIKCTEPTFIIGIASLTPRIMYTQGNEWYNTELDTIDDLHKPELDAIAFQNLLGERMAWWDTKLTKEGVVVNRSVIGKLPAWIHYTTNFDRAYGDMAGGQGAGYMILNRDYERDTTDGSIKDVTTYVDPTKYNYAFAYTGLDSQNFYLQIQFDIKERWLGSAHQIPNA